MTYFYPVIHYRSRGNGVDLSNDIVKPQYLLNGYTAHNANNSLITGIYDPIDLSMDTVSPQTLANAYTTHNANGVSIIVLWKVVMVVIIILNGVQTQT
jgi:hypothetical protein